VVGAPLFSDEARRKLLRWFDRWRCSSAEAAYTPAAAAATAVSSSSLSCQEHSPQVAKFQPRPLRR
jgi:hypothetical protein